MPNITGQLQNISKGNDNSAQAGFYNQRSGCFTNYIPESEMDEQYWTSKDRTNHNKDQNFSITFDASRSSSIYGKSTTVQPPAYVVNIWKRTA